MARSPTSKARGTQQRWKALADRAAASASGRRAGALRRERVGDASYDASTKLNAHVAELHSSPVLFARWPSSAQGHGQARLGQGLLAGAAGETDVDDDIGFEALLAPRADGVVR